jgi:capsular polysaccharide biosynthesis protein
MKRKVLIAIVGFVFVVFGGVVAGQCDEAKDPKLSKSYGAFVDKYIQKCETKAEMLDSSSLNIRRSAMQATVKGAFVQANRTEIINYLMKEKAPLNADRIAYHLNRRYAESIYPQEVYAVLSREHVNR